MKLLRFAVLPALLLLLALPSAADARRSPAIEGPPASAIEGTITSLHVPIAGGGPIVSLLSGLVSFDATGATVRFADGTPATTDDLEAGQRVVAFVDPAVSPLKATAILVMVQREDVSLTGRVEAADLSASTITVLGFTALVTGKTVFGGPWDGVGKPDLGRVKVGDLVLVAAAAESGSLVALRVMKLSPSPTPTVRLHGVVGAIGTDSWTLVLPDGTESVVKVDAGTKIVGNPAVGDEVDVLARRQADGTLLAVLILEQVEPPPVAEVSFEGVVKRITGAMWHVGDTQVVVSKATEVRGDPKVGDTVRVKGVRMRGAVVHARLVEKL